MYGAMEIVKTGRFVRHAHVEKSPYRQIRTGDRLMPCISINDREALIENLAAVKRIHRKRWCHDSSLIEPQEPPQPINTNRLFHCFGRRSKKAGRAPASFAMRLDCVDDLTILGIAPGGGDILHVEMLMLGT